MRRIEPTTQFERDYKRVAKGQYRATLDSDMKPVLQALANDQAIEPRHRDHALTGEWKDHRDCHIKPDLDRTQSLAFDPCKPLKQGAAVVCQNLPIVSQKLHCEVGDRERKRHEQRPKAGLELFSKARSQACISAAERTCIASIVADGATTQDRRISKL